MLWRSGNAEFPTPAGCLLEKHFEAAVIIAPIRGHNAFVADFAPIILVKQVLDPGEDTDPAIPKFHFRSQIPNVVGGNGALESIVRIAKLIGHDGAKKTNFHNIFVAIDSASLDLVIRSVGWRHAVVMPGGEFGVEQSDVAVDRQCAPGTLSASVDEPENVELAGGLKSHVMRVTDVSRGCKSVRQTNVANLIVEREIEAADVEIQVR